MPQDLVFHLRGVLAGLEVLLGGLEGALDVLRFEQLGRSFQAAVIIVVKDELPLFRPGKKHPMTVQHSRSDRDVQYIEFCRRLRIAVVGLIALLGRVVQRPRGEDASRSEVDRSEEHTSELQSLAYLVCRLLLEKK